MAMVGKQLNLTAAYLTSPTLLTFQGRKVLRRKTVLASMVVLLSPTLVPPVILPPLPAYLIAVCIPPLCIGGSDSFLVFGIILPAIFLACLYGRLPV